MRNYDTEYQAFRREWLHRFSNMDPDELVCELGIDTDTLMDAIWFKVEEYIEKEYEYYGEEVEGEDED